MNRCFWTVVLKKTLENPLDCKKIQPVYPKGDQSWAFIGRTDAVAETPVLWPPDSKNWLIGKDLDAGKDWRQEEKGTAEDEMVGWHHWLNEPEFEQAPGTGDRQGSLACCGPWGHKELDMTEGLSWTDWCLLEFPGLLLISKSNNVTQRFRKLGWRNHAQNMVSENSEHLFWWSPGRKISGTQNGLLWKLQDWVLWEVNHQQHQCLRVGYATFPSGLRWLGPLLRQILEVYILTVCIECESNSQI